jgi:hypothetical protein
MAMAPIQQTSFEVIILLAGLWLLSKGVHILHRPTQTTRLKGPKSKSLVFGNSRFPSSQQDVTLVLEEWAKCYSAVFCIPEVLGCTTIILCNPKIIQHFYLKETYGYVYNALGKALTTNIVCQAFTRTLPNRGNLSYESLNVNLRLVLLTEVSMSNSDA